MNNENNAIHTENENKNEDSALKAKIDEIVDKIKGLVKKGNVSRVIIRRDGNDILNVPMNVGIVGGVIGLVAAPWWTLIAATLAALGLKCEILVVTDDGNTVDVM